MKRTIISTCILLCGLGFFHNLTAQNRNERNDPEFLRFQKISDYLCEGSGRWTGENKNYNPDNPRSPKAFGLWFEKPLNNLLALKIVAYQKDTVIISSQGTFMWHPIKRQFLHATSDRGGGYAEGITEFVNDSTFISTMVNYRPNGNSYDHKDENFIVNKDIHRNISYSKDAEGNWVESGRWVWTRDKKRGK